MKEITNIEFLLGTLKANLPSRSVIVPCEVPFTWTLAPGTPSPKLSFTVPLTSTCASTKETESRISPMEESILFLV